MRLGSEPWITYLPFTNAEAGSGIAEVGLASASFSKTFLDPLASAGSAPLPDAATNTAIELSAASEPSILRRLGTPLSDRDRVAPEALSSTVVNSVMARATLDRK